MRLLRVLHHIPAALRAITNTFATVLCALKFTAGANIEKQKKLAAEKVTRLKKCIVFCVDSLHLLVRILDCIFCAVADTHFADKHGTQHSS